MPNAPDQPAPPLAIPPDIQRRLLQELWPKLVQGAEDYHHAPRNAAFGSVFALAGFIADLEAVETAAIGERPVELALPLMRLAQAIASLSEGVADPLLAIPHGAGRRGVNIYELMARADAAGTMNVLMESGLSERDAAAKVASALRQSDIMQGLRGSAATAVMNWRKRIVGTGVKAMIQDLPEAPEWDAQAAGIYNLATDKGRELMRRPGTKPAQVRAFILSRLKRRHPPVSRDKS